MKLNLAAAIFVGLCQLAHAHGHDHGEPEEGETIQEYAIRHMVKEHHIDEFDLQSFFALHDLNGDGILDTSEIEAIYGVHHLDSQKKSPDEAAHSAKAQRIVREVLVKMDTNRDGSLSPEEFVAAGFAGLPDFTELGAEGHHYDEESEFFLHHEEMYHNTPETQTDDSYVHAEDIEHFNNHEKIELAEENKERKFQGLSELTAEEMHKLHEEEDAALELRIKEAEAEAEAAKATSSAKFQRPAKPDAKELLKGAVREANQKSEWGTGEDGYKRPKTPADKLRKNVPYKYKFRRNWGDF